MRSSIATEVAIPWQILTGRGIEVVFTTEHGHPAETDPLLLTGVVFGQLGAREDAKAAYRSMTATDAFRHPLRWADVAVADDDGLLLPGGHASGMRQ
jgi:putative intracellular protease/amidase